MPCTVFKRISTSCDSPCWATTVSGHMGSLSDQPEIFPVLVVCQKYARWYPEDSLDLAASEAKIRKDIMWAASRCCSCCNQPTYLHPRIPFLSTIPNVYFGEEGLNSFIKTKQKSGLFIVYHPSFWFTHPLHSSRMLTIKIPWKCNNNIWVVNPDA